MTNKTMYLTTDAATFKKLIVPAYIASDKFSGYTPFQNILLTNDEMGWLKAYGTDNYQSYRTRISPSKYNYEVSSNFRLCLNAESIVKNIAKKVEPNTRVTLTLIQEHPFATVRIANEFFRVTESVPVFNEDAKPFPEADIDKLFVNVLEAPSVFSKKFNLVFLEKMSKVLKTTIESPKERKSIKIEIDRSDISQPEGFSFSNWFDAVIMPIK